jgi:hypothetical protein
MTITGHTMQCTAWYIVDFGPPHHRSVVNINMLALLTV